MCVCRGVLGDIILRVLISCKVGVWNKWNGSRSYWERGSNHSSCFTPGCIKPKRGRMATLFWVGVKTNRKVLIHDSDSIFSVLWELSVGDRGSNLVSQKLEKCQNFKLKLFTFHWQRSIPYFEEVRMCSKKCAFFNWFLVVSRGGYFVIFLWNV